MEQKINTGNPEAMTYTTEELGYTILGGIRLEGLDRWWRIRRNKSTKDLK